NERVFLVSCTDFHSKGHVCTQMDGWVGNTEPRLYGTTFRIDARGKVVEFGKEFSLRKSVRRSERCLPHFEIGEIFLIDLGSNPSFAICREGEERLAGLDGVSWFNLTREHGTGRACTELGLR